MQRETGRRSNKDRSDATTTQLIDAARGLFIERGYAETSTPDIVAAAGVTRGALYHHFADKQALFRAVVEREAETVAAAIEAAAPDDLRPRDALVAGGEAYLAAMAEAGRTRLLLLDGPAVLGRAEMDAIDLRHGTRTLREGIAAAMRGGAMRKLPVDEVTMLLSSAFDRAALAIDGGARPENYRTALAALIDGLMNND
jgi:AcrR family transcriptional regulator